MSTEAAPAVRRPRVGLAEFADRYWACPPRPDSADRFERAADYLRGASV